MKRSKIYIVLVLISALFLFDGCKKKTEDKADDCTSLSENASNASQAFITNPSEATCEAYVQAIHDLYNGCTAISAAIKDNYDAWLASVDCSIYGDGK